MRITSIFGAVVVIVVIVVAIVVVVVIVVVAVAMSSFHPGVDLDLGELFSFFFFRFPTGVVVFLFINFVVIADVRGIFLFRSNRVPPFSTVFISFLRPFRTVDLVVVAAAAAASGR